MKSLIKFAVGAAIAGALAKLLIKQLSGKGGLSANGERFATAAISALSDMVAKRSSN